MTLEELIVKITGDTSGLEKAFGSVASGAGKMASAVGKSIAAATAAGAAAVGAITTQAVQNYAEYEQLVGGVETLFKDSAGIVEEYADNAYKTAGMSANQYMETVTAFSASLLQSVGGDTEAAAKSADMAITDMADNANKMGTSIESIQNAYQGFAKQNYTMLDNLKLGYGGTKEEMERLLADAEKLTGVKYDISNLNDVFNAIHVIQTELGITGTTATEASSTIQGSAAAMKAAWSNMLTCIADENADFDSLVGNLVESVATFAENILPRIEVALQGVGLLVQKLAPIIVEQLPGLIDAVLPPLLDAVTSLIDGIVAVIPELLPTLIEAFINATMTILQSVLEMMPDIIDAIVESFTIIIQAITDNLPMILDAIVQGLLLLVDAVSENLPQITEALVQGLITIVQAIIDNLPLFLDAFLQLLLSFTQAIVQAIPQIIAALPDMIVGIVQFIIQAIPQLIEAGIQLFTALVEALPEIIETIVAVLPELIDGIITAILEGLPLIVEAGIQLFVALVQALPEIITTICEALPQIIDAIITALLDNLPLIIETGVQLFVALVENLPTIIVEIVKAIPEIIAAIVKAIVESIPKIVEAGTQLVSGLFEGISNATQWLYDKISGWVGGVLDWIKGLFGIHSPSRETAEDGKYIAMGLGKGISDNIDYAVDAMTKTSRAVEKAFNPVVKMPDIDIGKQNIDDITATAKINPVFAQTEFNQKSTMELKNTNTDLISTLLQMTKQLIEAIEENQPIFEIGDDEIAKSAARGNAEYKKRTGKPIFA